MSVRSSVEGSVGRIVLDWPEKLERLHRRDAEGAGSGPRAAEADEAVRVVLVASASDKAFCAGADINEWSPLGPLGKWAK